MRSRLSGLLQLGSHGLLPFALQPLLELTLSDLFPYGTIHRSCALVRRVERKRVANAGSSPVKISCRQRRRSVRQVLLHLSLDCPEPRFQLVEGPHDVFMIPRVKPFEQIQSLSMFACGKKTPCLRGGDASPLVQALQTLGVRSSRRALLD